MYFNNYENPKEQEDFLSNLSPNLKLLRYLTFRSCGMLFLHILKEKNEEFVQYIKNYNDLKNNRENVYEMIFFSMMEFFFISLLYQECDLKVLNIIQEISYYFKINKLIRFTFEYYKIYGKNDNKLFNLISKKEDFKNNFKNFLCYIDLYDFSLEGLKQTKKYDIYLNQKYNYLINIKNDYKNRLVESKTVNYLNVYLDINDFFSWIIVLEEIDNAVNKKKKHECFYHFFSNKHRFIPCLPNRIKFIFNDKLENDSKVFDSNKKCDNKHELSCKHDLQKDEISESALTNKNSSSNKKQILSQRCSKRLAKLESDFSINNFIFTKDNFINESNNFYNDLKVFFFNLDFKNYSDIKFDLNTFFSEFEDIDKFQFVVDFISLLNDWECVKPLNLFFFNSKSYFIDSFCHDQKTRNKVLSFLMSFNKMSFNESQKNVANINDYENVNEIKSFLISLKNDNHYFDTKFEILLRFLCDIEIEEKKHICLITDTEWPSNLFLKVNSWVMDMEYIIYERIKLKVSQNFHNFSDLTLSISIYEILVDTFIFIENELHNLVDLNLKKNKKKVEILCLKFINLNDKIEKWEDLIANLFYKKKYYNKYSNNLFLKLNVRFKWCKIHKLILKIKDFRDVHQTIKILDILKNYINNQSINFSVNYINFKKINQFNITNLKILSARLSMLFVFLKIFQENKIQDSQNDLNFLNFIFKNFGSSNQNSDQDEKLNDLNFIKVDSQILIQNVLKTLTIDMKLNLWLIFFLYFKINLKHELLDLKFEEALNFCVEILFNPLYINQSFSTRIKILFGMLEFFCDILHLEIENLNKNFLDCLSNMINKYHLKKTFVNLFQFFKILHLFIVYENFTVRLNIKSIVEKKFHSFYKKIKKAFIELIIIIILKFKVFMFLNLKLSIDELKQPLFELVNLFHNLLSNLNFCDYDNGFFLNFAENLFFKFNLEFNVGLLQVISCKYHYNILINDFISNDHKTSFKENINKNNVHKLSNYILKLYFENNSILEAPKQDMKTLVDTFYHVIGDFDFKSNYFLKYNYTVIENYLSNTQINSKLIYNSFHGLLELPFNQINDPNIYNNRIYYLEALIMFSTYKSKKKNQSLKNFELEKIILLFKKDLILNLKSAESWFFLGQSYGLLIEDELIFTNNKITVSNRRLKIANLQRKSLLCYLTSINEIICLDSINKMVFSNQFMSSLFFLFSKELYSACMVPMSMLVFKISSLKLNIKNKTNGFSSNYPLKTTTSKLFLNKIIQFSLCIAIKLKSDQWIYYYYLSKVKKKLKKSSLDVLKTMQISCKLAKDNFESFDFIIEPFYKLISLVYKYYKNNELSLNECISFLKELPMELNSEINEKSNLCEIIISCLKKLISFDKKKWHHKPHYRIAKILYESEKNVKEALDELSILITFKHSNKSLVSIWKPQNERPCLHYFYSYQYVHFYIFLLSQNKDLINLILMLSKLRKYNFIIKSSKVIWSSLCSIICKIIRQLIQISDTFLITEIFFQNFDFKIYNDNLESINNFLTNSDVSQNLKVLIFFLNSLIEMKKNCGSYGSTLLVDDTIIWIFMKINDEFKKHKILVNISENDTTKSEPSKLKKYSKKTVFSHCSDFLKICKKSLDLILKEDLNFFNEFIRSKNISIDSILESENFTIKNTNNDTFLDDLNTSRNDSNHLTIDNCKLINTNNKRKLDVSTENESEEKKKKSLLIPRL